MDKNHGFVKIYRKITDWGWYKDANTARVFIHLLLNANFTEKEWMGQKIPMGSLVTSQKNIAKELNLSVQNVRTALKNLKSTHEVTVTTTPHYSVITLVKYNKYQNNNTQTNIQLTSNQHPTNIQLTTTKECKERKKGRRGEELHHIFEKLREERK